MPDGLIKGLIDYAVSRGLAEEADRLLVEKGAVLRISTDRGAIGEADIIIAPERLTQPLGCSGEALIFSAAAPECPQPSPVIRQYSFDLPGKLCELCPDYLDPMYFASALYTLAGVHELGSSVFTRCCDGRVLHTRMSLLKQLRTSLTGASEPCCFSAEDRAKHLDTATV